MVKSMTGFGKITIENGNRKVVIEIKSLNSKTYLQNNRKVCVGIIIDK